MLVVEVHLPMCSVMYKSMSALSRFVSGVSTLRSFRIISVYQLQGRYTQKPPRSLLLSQKKIPSIMEEIIILNHQMYNISCQPHLGHPQEIW